MMKRMNWKKIIYNNSKIRKISEIVFVYILLPLLILFDFINVPIMVILIPLGIIVFFYLRADKTFNRKYFYNWENAKKEIKNILILFIIAAVLMLTLIHFIAPAKMFIILRTRPWLMFLICFSYPLLSVVPQGLAYRAFFFHRYKDLFPNNLVKILVSAALFSFGHIFYKNIVVLIITFIAGVLFAYRYNKSKSLLISVLEHALLGVWVFASGLGYFFISTMVD